MSLKQAGRPARAMVLAAGMGLRLRPITDKLPKPLIEIGGRALIDRALDRLEDAGVAEAVVNTHYMAEAVERHLARRKRPAVRFSREDELLETGGGVLKALDKLGAAPFYVVNSDIAWLDGPKPALERLADAWNDARMDALLLVNSAARAADYEGSGDFFMAPGGRLRRRKPGEIAPYVFCGVQLLHPRLFAGAKPGRFSLNLLYDRAEAAGRLYAVVHDGAWYHIGTPAGLALAARALRRVDRKKS
ncbi:MAG: nucleotidyltransferase family protein [Rhodospirillales bacterium]